MVQPLQQLLNVLVALGCARMLMLLHEEVLVEHMLLRRRQMRMRVWCLQMLLLLLLSMRMRIGQSVGRRSHQMVRGRAWNQG